MITTTDAICTEYSLLTIKGAPDVLMGRISSYITRDGTACAFNARARAGFEAAKNAYSSQGKRCILLARKLIPHGQLRNQPGTGSFEDEIGEEAAAGLTLVGIVALVDPLRPEIKEVVSTLRGAGIRFFMVCFLFTLSPPPPLPPLLLLSFFSPMNSLKINTDVLQLGHG